MISNIVADAYAYLSAGMPCVLLVQLAKLLPMNETYRINSAASEN
ncbi:MAG: hypothetical protein AAF330_01395 [Pseudomonadota bacterium]